MSSSSKSWKVRMSTWWKTYDASSFWKVKTLRD